MAFCELKYFSNALQKATAADILLPEQHTQGPFPVLYLLHGLSDDCTIWQRRTSVERYVAGLPLIVVMPGWRARLLFPDARQGMAWESAIVEDLVSYVDAMFRTRAERKGRIVAGLSMGGYGAAKFALKYPDKFGAAVSHSGAMRFANRPMPLDADDERRAGFNREFARVVGADPVGGPHDLFALAANLDAANRPALRVDCGVDDFLIDDNRAFHAHLDSIGFAHEYHEFPGAHTWEYWDEHIQEAIRFLMPYTK